MQTQQTTFTQEPLFELESLTVLADTRVSDLKKEVKTTREMIKEAYLRSDAYKQLEERVSEAKQKLKEQKTQLDQAPEIKALSNTLKTKQEELKETQVSISDYALEYERLAKKSEIERNGVTYEIVKTAKLVKRLT